MAKMMKSDMSMTCPSGSCGPKCIVLGLLGAVLAGAGIWMLVGGALMQYGRMPWMNTLLWYAGGCLLIGIGKKSKMAACGWCRQ